MERAIRRPPGVETLVTDAAPHEGERIVLIIGTGHVPILRHAIQASPEYELIEVAEVLARAR